MLSNHFGLTSITGKIPNIILGICQEKKLPLMF